MATPMCAVSICMFMRRLGRQVPNCRLSVQSNGLSFNQQLCLIGGNLSDMCYGFCSHLDGCLCCVVFCLRHVIIFNVGLPGSQPFVSA